MAKRIIKKITKNNPKEIGLEIGNILKGLSLVSSIEVAGPGFINIFLNHSGTLKIILFDSSSTSSIILLLIYKLLNSLSSEYFENVIFAVIISNYSIKNQEIDKFSKK